ncbi:MAG TPA: low affinity iron permease family protein [Candidatus Eisenbacteria bacterium]|nr:low affinity iron permease family protein [Candidatus Eisenbacteria bacterium]
MKNTDTRTLERLMGGFQRFARTVVRTSGHPMAFGLAIGVIVIWALTGPLFHFGNTWLLVIDTVANIITFLMIFLIRNAQNRESEAVQLKLDELIRATKAARNTLLDIEELSEEELDRIKSRFERLARKARTESGVDPTELLRQERHEDSAIVPQSTGGIPPVGKPQSIA